MPKFPFLRIPFGFFVQSRRMAERIGGQSAPPTPATAISPDEVLTFSFLPITQSYIASSYPYPVQSAKFANPNITRDVVL